jgi:hypothetical protein
MIERKNETDRKGLEGSGNHKCGHLEEKAMTREANLEQQCIRIEQNSCWCINGGQLTIGTE